MIEPRYLVLLLGRLVAEIALWVATIVAVYKHCRAPCVLQFIGASMVLTSFAIRLSGVSLHAGSPWPWRVEELFSDVGPLVFSGGFFWFWLARGSGDGAPRGFSVQIDPPLP